MHWSPAFLIYNARSTGQVDEAAEDGEAERAILRALELDSNDSQVLSWCGQTLVMTLGRLQEGAALLDQAIRIDPNFAEGLIYRGSARIALGKPEMAIGDLERALRLSPLDSNKAYGLTLLGRAQVLCGNLDKARPLIAEALRRRPNFRGALLDSVVANALAGDVQVARQSLAAFQKIVPEVRMARVRQWRHLSIAGHEIYARGLRLAGLPE